MHGAWRLGFDRSLCEQPFAGTTGLIALMGVAVGAAMAPDRWQDATLEPPGNRGMRDAGPLRVGLRIAF